MSKFQSEQIIFYVQGSESEPYEVIFTRSGKDMTATCTCRAGLMRMPCKHRRNILEEKTANIVDVNPEDMERISEMLDGTHLEKAIENVKEAEKEAKLAKERLDDAKGELSIIMHVGG